MNEPRFCPNPECEGGSILIYNAYSADPLIPEAQPCGVCGGSGILISNEKIALTN